MAQIVLPFTFETGQLALASEVNSNFSAIVGALNLGLNSDNLAAGSVGSAQLIDSSVTSEKVADGSLFDRHVSGLANLGLSKLASLPEGRAVATDLQGKLTASAVTLAELERLSSVSGNVQQQLDDLQGHVDDLLNPPLKQAYSGTFMVGGGPPITQDLERGLWVLRMANPETWTNERYPLRVMMRVTPTVTINLAPDYGPPDQGIMVFSTMPYFAGAVGATRVLKTGSGSVITVDAVRLHI